MEPFPFQLICFISSEVCFHHLLPGLVRNGNIGFQGIVLHLSTSTVYLYRRYDNLLLLDHRRSAPPCEEGGEGSISRLLLRRHHTTVWQERICFLSGREGDRAVYGDRTRSIIGKKKKPHPPKSILGADFNTASADS